MPSLFLLIYCSIVFEQLHGMNYIEHDKRIKLGFSETQFLTPCLSVRLSVFPQVLKNIKQCPLNFSFADAVASYHSGIKRILRQLLDIHTNTCIYEVSTHEIPLHLTAFKVPFTLLKLTLCTQSPPLHKLVQ
jgi:hypothetical protein